MDAPSAGVNLSDNETTAVGLNTNQHGVELVAPGDVPVDPEKSRSKLRIAAILTALYVSSTPVSNETSVELMYCDS
jgi:hypothetical protein